MDRRKFLKRLGLGAATVVAGVAVAPKALEFLVTPAPSASVIGTYAEYSNFSQFAIAKAWDEMIDDCAKELAFRARYTMASLQNQFVESLG